MKKTLIKSANRGHANHGWLNARHTFSFGSWYNPNQTNFGALRVLNDDIVAPSMGFSSHPHDNMEIITIPLSGALKHKDNMGNSSVIHAGEVQVMSAGTGIYHSEVNASTTEELNLFQIWIFPNTKNVTPRYDQIPYSFDDLNNQFVQVVSPNKEDEGTWIYQNAWIHLAQVDENNEICYELKDPSNGAFVMNIEGVIIVDDERLDDKDAVGIEGKTKITIKGERNSRLMVIEVPLNY